MEKRWSALLLGFLFSLAVAKKSDYRTAYACEGSQLHLLCEEGFLIHILRANYGRYSISICNEHGSLDWSVDCASYDSYRIIYESCDMKASCSLPAASAVFGDPCPGTLKYLEAHYKCVPESMTTTSSTSTTVGTTTTTTRPPIIIPLTRSVKPTILTTPFKPTTTTIYTTTNRYPSTKVTIVSSTPRPRTTISRPLINEATHCQPTQSRNLSWGWTKAGEVVVQKCPSGTLGEARWRCGTDPIQWVPESPDLSECSSLWVDNLRSRIDSGDSVVNIATELSVMTHRKLLYGGDVRHATEFLHNLISKMADKMQEIADDKQRHQLLKELLESAADVTSNLLEASKPWGELPASERRHVASTLIEALEQSGWLLAKSHRSTFHFSKARQNLLLSVRVLEAWAVSEVKFPLEKEIDGPDWGQIQDCVQLPTQALLAAASNGVVKMVFASYRRVKDFLGTVASSRRGILHNSSHIINSRVISASTGTYPVMKFAEPVIITFKLLQEENVTNPQCVYWDLDTRLWSQEGCWLRKSNQTHAVCACDHLTNFALLMEVKFEEEQNDVHLLSRIIVFTSCAIAIILFLLTVILLQTFRNFPNDHSTIHKHLCVCLMLVEAIYIGGADQAGNGFICAFLAGALHLLLQAVFVWLFLAAFQLYLLLLEPAHSNHSRIRCYSFVAYGVSSLIVGVSAIIDPSSYGTANYCFLRYDNYYVFSFVGPAVSCILGAVMFLGLTLCRTCWFSSAKNKELVKANTAKIRSREAWFVVLSSGGSWTFLLLYLEQKITVLAYLFAALNFLQGLAVFICFGLRNSEVRQAYHNWQNGSSDQQPKSGGRQFPLPTTSSQHSVGLQTPTTVSSLSTVTTPEMEFQLGAPHPFHHSELCHITRSPIYTNRERLVM